MSEWTSKTARFDANGRAEVVVQGPETWQTWTVIGTAVSSDSQAMPRFSLYRNNESPTSFLGGTFLGGLNSSTGSDRLRNGEQLVGVWVGGDVGATATLVVTYEPESA